MICHHLIILFTTWCMKEDQPTRTRQAKKNNDGTDIFNKAAIYKNDKIETKQNSFTTRNHKKAERDALSPHVCTSLEE